MTRAECILESDSSYRKGTEALTFFKITQPNSMVLRARTIGSIDLKQLLSDSAVPCAANPPAIILNQISLANMEPISKLPTSGADKYDDYYSDGRVEKWRLIGAKNKADNIEAFCSSICHDRVLEIGCGSGAILQQLGQRGFAKSLSGIEISSSGIEQLKSKNIASLDEVLLFDGKNVPFADASFDLAILSHVVEHVELPRAILSEARRVARYVFVEVPLEHTLRLKPDYDFNETGHINYYTATTIRRLLQTSDLIVERQIVTDTTKEMVVFQKGRKGAAIHYVRRISLYLFPWLAQQVFVYHSALLARSTHS